MSKMNDIAMTIEELRSAAAAINKAASWLAELFSSNEPSPEPMPTEPALTLEAVRAVLADKSRAGFTAQIRSLLQKYGADKLSGIDQDNYKALLDQGLVPIEKVTKDMRVWDGENWVRHDGVVFKGEREVIEYEGLTATPDHLVWVEGQSKPIQFGIATTSGAHLIQTGNDRQAIRLGNNNQPGKAMESKLESLLCFHSVYRLRTEAMAKSRQFTARKVKRLPAVFSAQADPGVAGQTPDSGQAAMRKPERSGLSQLWRERYSVRFSKCHCSRPLLDKEIRYSKTRFGNRSNRQQPKLRPWESSLLDTCRKQLQQTVHSAYSQFCERFRTWRKENSKEVTLSLERKPGEVMEVDWAGDTMDLLCDRVTGELHTVYLFVATIGNSDLYFARAFTDMKLNSWIQANTGALEFFGALPRIVTPDNTKTAVYSHVKYDPVLNATYREWAEFYSVAVIPARPRKPKDKNMVEHGVGYLETWILGRLRHRYFFSMNDLNQEIQNILQELNNKPYQKRDGTRQSVFQKIDRPAMRPLPTTRFENPEYKTCTVGSNYHIEFENSNYSIPYTYIHKKVTIRATSTTVEVLYDNQRICSHPRNYDTHKRYITDRNHMPEKHRGYVEQTDWNGNRYRSWAKKVGPQTYAVVDAMLSTHVIEEQAYKSCMGLLQLSKKYGSERLESACARAAELGGFQYTTVKNILKNDQDQRPILTGTDNLPLPEHKNIRGPEYYK